MGKEYIFDLNNKKNWEVQQQVVSTAIQIFMRNSKTSLVVKIDEFKTSKSYKQLRGFYECINQLLPQYNARQLEQGKKEFFADEFKFIGHYFASFIKKLRIKEAK